MKIKIGEKTYSLTSKEVRLKGIVMLIIATIFILLIKFINPAIINGILYMSGAWYLAIKAMLLADIITNWYIKRKKNVLIEDEEYPWFDPDDLLKKK